MMKDKPSGISQSAKGLKDQVAPPYSFSPDTPLFTFETTLLKELKQVVEGSVLLRDVEKRNSPNLASSPSRLAPTALPPYPSSKGVLAKNETEFASSTRVFNSAAQVAASFVVRPRHTKDVVEWVYVL